MCGGRGANLWKSILFVYMTMFCKMNISAQSVLKPFTLPLPKIFKVFDCLGTVSGTRGIFELSLFIFQVLPNSLSINKYYSTI